MFWLILIIVIVVLVFWKKQFEHFGVQYTKSDFVLWPGFLEPIPKDTKTINVLMKNSYIIEKVSKDIPKPVGKQKYCYMTDCPPEVERTKIENSNANIVCWRCI